MGQIPNSITHVIPQLENRTHCPINASPSSEKRLQIRMQPTDRCWQQPCHTQPGFPVSTVERIHVLALVQLLAVRKSRGMSTVGISRPAAHSYIRELCFTIPPLLDGKQILKLRAMERCEGHNLYLNVLPNRRLPYSNAKQVRDAMRSVKWPAAARLLESQVRLPLRAWMFVFCVRCESCRYRPVRQPYHSYRGVLLVSCVCVSGWSINLNTEAA